MAQIIHHFCSISGQTPNWAKSAIIFSSRVSQAVAHDIKQIFPVSNMEAHFSHLGHPLILPAKNRSAAYNFVLDKFLNKLPAYKANMLSHAARLELKIHFSTIPVYYMANILFSKNFKPNSLLLLGTFGRHVLEKMIPTGVCVFGLGRIFAIQSKKVGLVLGICKRLMKG